MTARCGERIFVKSLKKCKACLRPRGHKGTHTPDLMGEKIGRLTVVKQGESVRHGSQLTTTWVVEQNGAVRRVFANGLINGHNRGSRCLHGFTMKNGKPRPEYSTVESHHSKIFKSTEHPTYKGMPFYELWDPDKFGSYHVGAKWIIDNLGEKPGKEWSLDIVEHHKGFVPGNLRWAKKHTQARNKWHKTLGRFSVREIRVEARRHGYKLVRL